VRFAVLVMHRRCGKTTAVLNHHQRAALDDDWEAKRLRFLEPKFTNADIKELLRGRKYAHILPTLTQARAVAWGLLKYYASEIPGHKPNEQDMSITYPNGNVVRLFGADNPDALRGHAFSGVSFDEYSQQPPNIFGEVISKALADHLGYAIFIGTIKGKNHLYRTYQAGKDDAKNWFSVWQDVDQSLATETGPTIMAIKRAMQDDLDLITKGLMTQEEFDQEWYLSETAAIKGAYYAKQLVQARRDKRIGLVPYDPALLVYDVWDLGKGPNLVVGMFQRTGREVHLIDREEADPGEAIPQMIARLQRKPYVFGKHFAPHDIKATELGTGKTRLETSRNLGWSFIEVPSVTVDDGIDKARLMFSRLWIDEQKCVVFLDAIGQYRQEWDEKRGVFRDVPLHDWTSHDGDMLRYAALVEDQMVNEKPRPPKVPIRHMPVSGDMAWAG
jgi:phage terminase large subunit